MLCLLVIAWKKNFPERQSFLRTESNFFFILSLKIQQPLNRPIDIRNFLQLGISSFIIPWHPTSYSFTTRNRLSNGFELIFFCFFTWED